MDKDDRSSGGFPGGGLIMIALLAVGAFVITKPMLESSRPAISEPRLERREAAQDVDARLWQDPFGAVAKARERPQKSPDGKKDEEIHSEQRFADELQRQARLSGDSGVFVVAVMLFGGPYTEQVESRRRMRYAVLAGLQARGYVPGDNEHLGYFYPYGGLGPKYGLPETVPFESFEREPSSSSERCNGCRLVVLWLDSSPFNDRPLRTLAELAARVEPSGTTAAGTAPRVRWRVLGPAYSDGVRDMVEEAAAETFDPGALKRFDFRFFSSGATAPDAVLLGGRPGKTVSDYLETRGVPLIRTIGTDDRLAAALKEELCRRGLQDGSDKCANALAIAPTSEAHSTIAIIAEGDTLYGRSLRQQFRSDRNQTGFSITRWHYFRGIDGRLPGDTAPQAADSRNKKDQKAEGTDAIGRDTAYFERPEGTSQYDYLRRLASRIRSEDKELRHEKGPRQGIRAIGVFGNDAYDKLLVLQALQPEIPQAIYFTTDLDARLFHPREQAWARNLIVASSFGLTLTDGLQRAISPFRDSYQTAAYLATLMLIADARLAADHPDAAPLWKQDRVNQWFETPRLFEVTRSGVFDFSPGRPADHCKPRILGDCDDIHPGGSHAWPDLRFLPLWLTFALLTAALWVPALALSRGARRRLRRFVAAAGPSDKSRLRRRVALLALFVALVAVPAALLAHFWPSIAAWMTQGGNGKPLTFTDGISPWPTYLIRLGALVICIYFVGYAWSSLKANVDRIAHEFRLGSTRRRLDAALAAAESQRTWWQRLASMFEVRFYRESVRASGAAATALTPKSLNFWMHYIAQNSLRARLIRTGFCVIVMLVFFLLIYQASADQPLAPLRGTLTGHVHLLTIVPTVLASQFLIFFVADAAVLCVLFMRGLRMHCANWPEPTLEAFQARLGIPVQYLDDWIDLEFVARRTHCVATLIYLPFIVLSLMIVARSSFFDDWYAPVALHIVTAISIAVVLACALALRRSAEASRRQALIRLRDAALRAKGEPGGAPLASQLEALRDRVERLRDGAFAPYSAQPLLKAVLLPLLTFGGTSLFDYLSLANL
ncbi:MAG TPA: hypothetical protein PLE54_11750 [Burkholderiaceae bacterium]|nr:hypothetical protein [Burkholderiaceae bacterium]HQR71272.1 hypothetical protein [Burkholderiaceae bacterium]